MISREIIQTKNQISPKVKSLVDYFLSASAIGRRYLFGRNEHSAVLSTVIDVDGIVDDFAEPNSVWNNKPVVKGNDVPKDGIIVNCSMSIRPVSAHKRIADLGVYGILSYSDLSIAIPDLVPLPKFVLETQMDFSQNEKKWATLSDFLFDKESRQILDDLLKFRLTGDYQFMNQYSFRPNDQYFENFIEYGLDEVFVDAGGYDGDTSKLFCLKNPNYKKVFLFEPSSINFEEAKYRLNEFRAIEFIELGVSDVIGSLWFNPDKGSASSIGETGSCQVNVTTIDQYIDSKVTFIKMDLEGWELKALMGARRHIIEDHPKIAIAVYHHPSDFWRIFEFIFSLRQDYKVFLRHYTEGWSESVMYFIPK